MSKEKAKKNKKVDLSGYNFEILCPPKIDPTLERMRLVKYYNSKHCWLTR